MVKLWQGFLYFSSKWNCTSILSFSFNLW